MTKVSFVLFSPDLTAVAGFKKTKENKEKQEKNFFHLYNNLYDKGFVLY